MTMPEQKKAVVPRLRFPEFRDAGPWEVKRVGYFLTESRIDGSTGDIAKKLTVKLWGGGVVSKNEYLPGSPNTKYYRRKAGQFIYSKLDFLNGAFGIIPYELDGYESTLDLPAFDFTKAIVPRFFLEYVKRPQFYKKHGEQADGSRKAKRIQVDYFLDLYVAVPCLAEQQKIADCLSSLDELIELQAKKLEALQAHKKGLMQQLFPREGETTPRLRFPEFRDAGPWEVKRLGDESVAKFIRDTAPRSDLHPETYVSTENMLPDFGGITQASSLPASGTIKQYRRQDILIANIRPYLKKVWQADRNGTASNDVIVVRPSSDICPRYLGILLASDTFISYVMAGAKGLKMPRGDIALIKQYPVGLPTKIAEQQKIADCLSSLDELIELQAKQLEALKAHKKGLMQQLFPQEIDL